MRMQRLWIAGRGVAGRQWARLKAWRRFRPAALGFGVLVAVCLVVFSYTALLHRNNIAEAKHTSSHKKTADKSDGSKAASATAIRNAAAAAPVTAAPAPSAALPSSILNLTNWYLTLPTAKPGTSDEPQTIKQPQLNGFSLAPYFQVNAAHDGVVFQAPAGGTHTENSSYPRSELREMTDGGADQASWSDTSGTHVMTIREAITHLPSAKPQVVAGQVHDSEDDVIEIRLEGSNLFVEGDDGKDIGVLDGNYQLGAVFTVQIVATGGHIRVSYNGTQKVDYAKSGSGYYFKAGCYTQSNPSKGDSPSAYGEVVIYDLQVSHS